MDILDRLNKNCMVAEIDEIGWLLEIIFEILGDKNQCIYVNKIC